MWNIQPQRPEILPCRKLRSKTGPDCKICPLVNGCYEVKSTVTNRKHDVVHKNEVLTCHTERVIYLVTCSKCGIQYVGQTKTQLNKRWHTYWSDAKRWLLDPNCKVASPLFTSHFWGKQGCTVDDITLQPVEVVDEVEGAEGVKLLRERETHWMKTLRTYFPFGLNEAPNPKGQLLQSGEVEKLFYPILPVGPRVRGKRTNKREKPTVLSVYDTLVNFALKNSCYGWIGKVRVCINAQKKSTLTALAKFVHEKVEMVTNVRLRHLLLLCIELLVGRLVKTEPTVLKRKPPELVWSLHFQNHGANFLGLGRILNNPDLRKSLERMLPGVAAVDADASAVNAPAAASDAAAVAADALDVAAAAAADADANASPGTKIVWPSVVWRYDNPIRNTIFNYASTISEIRDWSGQQDCFCNCSSSSFCNLDHGHIITGNLSFVDHKGFRKILSLGPKLRQPKRVDFDSLRDALLEDVDNLIEKWSGLMNCSPDLWGGWKKKFCELLENRIAKLKRKPWKPPILGLDDPIIRRELELLHKHFVLIPADKAESNVIIVCKKFFIQAIVSELSGGNGTYEQSVVGKATIQAWVQDLKGKFGIDVPKDHQCCSSFYWTAKMHKVIIDMRFLAASHRCVTKGLSQVLTGLLKGVLRSVRTVANLRKRDTGADHCWVIDNSKPVLDRIKRMNAIGQCVSVDTFDFKDLYTKIPHKDLKEKLKFVIDLAFENSKHTDPVLVRARKDLGSVFTRLGGLSDKAKETAVPKEKLIEMVNHLIDHIYIKVGNRCFRQIVGIPMGTDCGPLLANLYLFGCEYSWLLKKWGTKADRHLVTAFAHCFRYIDDLITFNNRNVLSNHWKDIYPFLTLKKENEDSKSCTFLDLRFVVKEGQVHKYPYDKRDAFGFDIVSFPNLLSNIHFVNSHGVFTSQLIRFARLCDFRGDFSKRVKGLFDRLLVQGFSKRILKNRALRFYENYRHLLVKFSLATADSFLETF